jgi:hypothetical protein
MEGACGVQRTTKKTRRSEGRCANNSTDGCGIVRSGSTWTVRVWPKGPPVETFLCPYRRLRMDYVPPYQSGWKSQQRIWRRIRFEAKMSHDPTQETLW